MKGAAGKEKGGKEGGFWKTSMKNTRGGAECCADRGGSELCFFLARGFEQAAAKAEAWEKGKGRRGGEPDRSSLGTVGRVTGVKYGAIAERGP